LLDYIEQTTAFNSNAIQQPEHDNVFAEVYRLEQPSVSATQDQTSLHLVHHKSLRGRARFAESATDYTSFLGLGYAPKLSVLLTTLRAAQRRSANTSHTPTGRWFEFIWGDDIDPRLAEPIGH